MNVRRAEDFSRSTIVYFLSFTVIVTLTILNLFVAVIFEGPRTRLAEATGPTGPCR